MCPSCTTAKKIPVPGSPLIPSSLSGYIFLEDSSRCPSVPAERWEGKSLSSPRANRGHTLARQSCSHSVSTSSTQHQHQLQMRQQQRQHQQWPSSGHLSTMLWDLCPRSSDVRYNSVPLAASVRRAKACFEACPSRLVTSGGCLAGVRPGPPSRSDTFLLLSVAARLGRGGRVGSYVVR